MSGWGRGRGGRGRDWVTEDNGEDAEYEGEEEKLVEFDPFRNACLQGSHASEGVGVTRPHLKQKRGIITYPSPHTTPLVLTPPPRTLLRCPQPHLPGSKDSEGEGGAYGVHGG